MGRGRKKQLKMSKNDFFHMLVLRFGPPDPKAAQYPNPAARRLALAGDEFWVRYDERGREFKAIVRECGEAVTRAGFWHRQYRSWYEGCLRQRGESDEA